ncbi:MAG: GumC family protein [Armatimonadota bacterium]
MSDLPTKELQSSGQLARIQEPSDYPPPYSSIPPSNNGDIDLQELLAIFFRQKWIMIFVVAAVVFLGVIYTITRKPIFETTAEIVVVSNANGAPAPNGDMGIIGDLQALTRSRSIDTQVAIISSRRLLQKAFDDLPESLKTDGFNSDKIPLWAYKVVPKKNTDIIEVTAKSYDPAAAAELANNIANTYFLGDLEKNQMATRQARTYAEEQMIIINRDLDRASSALSAYKRQTGIVSPDTQIQKQAENIAKLQLDSDAAKVELASSAKQVDAIQRQLSSQEANVLSNTTITRNPEYSAVVDKITELNSERAKLLVEFTPGSKEIGKIDGQLKSQKEYLKTLAENITTSTSESRNPIRDSILTDYSKGIANQSASTARLKAVNSVLEAAKRKSLTLPEEERNLTERVQKVALLQRTYEMLSEKYYALLLNERAMLPSGQLITEAAIPTSPAYPNTKRNIALFFIFGVMISIGVAAILEHLDCSIHDQLYVERQLGVPTLSAIPEIPVDMPHLILDPGSSSLLSESYRILRNNISFSAIDNPIKMLAITSPGRGEGKSTTSANLAIAMAMDGKKVLLMDCDLRRPSQHRFFNLLRDKGFTNVVTGTCSLEDAILSTEVENLYILPSGPLPPNPSEFLNSQRSRELFDRVNSLYDMVIIDCPPSVGLSDVQVISTIADGVLMLVCMDKTLRPHLQITMRNLRQINAPLIGSVINRMELRRSGYYYHYDYYMHEDDDHNAIDKSKKKLHRKAINK